ncbi:MAG: HlyD family secretion protein, partial [Verrucomicrobiota bacterium]
DADKLRALQLDPNSRERPRSAVWIIFVCVGLAIALACWFAFGRGTGDSRTNGGAPPAGAANSEAKPGSTNWSAATGADAKRDGVVLTVSGYIINRERIELSPRFMGQVKWIGVRKGDVVTNGQVLVLLDDAEQQSRLKEVEGRVGNARVAVDKALLDYERMRKLIASKIETPQNEDDYRFRVDSARAMLREAEGALDLARTYVDWTVIRSSIDGVVLEKLVDAGELVTPQSFGGQRGPSTALVAIADPKDLQVEIDLNEADLAKVSRRQKCRVSPEAYPDRSYQGTVAEIAPEANRQKGTLQVKVQILNPDQFLTPELSAKVDFLSTAPVAAK